VLNASDGGRIFLIENVGRAQNKWVPLAPIPCRIETRETTRPPICVRPANGIGAGAMGADASGIHAAKGEEAYLPPAFRDEAPGRACSQYEARP
jgi:hypothetical protein